MRAHWGKLVACGGLALTASAAYTGYKYRRRPSYAHDYHDQLIVRGLPAPRFPSGSLLSSRPHRPLPSAHPPFPHSP